MTTPDRDDDDTRDFLENLSDEERAALEDEDTDTPAEAEGAAPEGEGDPEAPPADAAAEADPAPAVDAEDDDADEFVVPRMTAPETDGYDEQISQLLDQRKGVREQYRSGDISAEEKDEQEDAINDRIAELRADQRQARLAEDYNRKAAETEYARTVTDIQREIKRVDGIDYERNTLMRDRWDAKVRALAADEANAHQPAEWFLREGHKQVLVEIDEAARLLGYKREGGPKPASDAVRDAVKGRKPQLDGPRSLSGLPAAAQDSGRDNEFAYLDSLSGDELEAALARMTPEQEARYLR